MWGHGGKWGEVSPTFDQISEKESNRKKKRKKKGKKMGERREKEKERIFRCFDSRSSTVRELKSVHTMRATHGYQNQRVSSNSKR